MARSAAFLVALTVLTSFGLAGCGPDSFVPPRPPELDALAAPVKSAGGTIVMILPPSETPDRGLWSAIARRDVNRAKSAFELKQPETGQPPKRQAELILQSAVPGVTALLVEPMEGSEVAEALNKVRARGVPVVLLNRPIPNPDASLPFGLVSFSTTDKPLVQLAEAAKLELKNLELPASGSALILSDAFSPLSEQTRVIEMIKVFKEAGITNVDPFPVERDAEKARAALDARVKSDPKIAMLVGSEENSLRIALIVKSAQPVGRPLCVVGATSYDGKPDATLVGAAALVDMNMPEFAGAAVRLALKMIKGEKVNTDVVIPVTFLRQSEYSPAKGRVPVQSNMSK